MSEVNKEKLKALQLTMDKLEKTYGKGAVMKLGDTAVEAMEVIPSAMVLSAAINGRLTTALRESLRGLRHLLFDDGNSCHQRQQLHRVAGEWQVAS